MKKISKGAALYVHIRGTEYSCKDCAAFLPDADGCAFHTRSEVIRPYGGCGLFLLGKPATYTVRPHHPLLKVESGYVEHKPGLSCKRCEYFDARLLDCREVDRDSPGDDIGEISPDGCCNNWSKK